MDDLRQAFARLDARLESLERRIAALEKLSKVSPALTGAAHTFQKAAPAAGQLALPQAGGLFAVVGKAMLGIAGAYVLRAVAESGSFPKLAVVALALAYAGTWLIWAARAQAGFASTAYAATAALILAPMLGELTLRFGVLPATATAGVVSVYVVAASALAWKRDSAPMVWAAAAAGVVTAFALMIASHEIAPYTTALLVVAMVSQFAAARNRWLALRFLAAPAADVAVWLLIYIFALPESSRSVYGTVNPAALVVLPSLLFLIYGTGIASRTVLARQQIGWFEIAQAVVAFGLGGVSWIWFAPGAGRLGLGIFCWLLAAACYGAAFVLFDRVSEQRNYHVYATWSAALVLSGSLLLLPPLPLALGLSVAAIVATLVGARMARLTPEFHGLAFLAVAASVSGLLDYGARALAGAFPAAPGWTVWIVATSALVCYAIGGRFQGERWNHRLLRLLATILAVSAAATFLVSGVVWLAAIGMTPRAFHVAVIRTLITCALALALAYGGARWQRAELVWTAYGTLALVAAKLLFEDLPHGHSGSIAVSIFLYAAALMIIPRMARPRVHITRCGSNPRGERVGL